MAGRRRVLAVQLKRLGDLVLAVPALAALRATGAHVTLATESPFDEALAAEEVADVVRRHPPGWADSLRFGGDLAREGFDAAIDFQGSATSARLAWQSGAPVRLGWRLRGRRLAYTRAIERDENGAPRHTAERKLDLVRALDLVWALDLPTGDPTPRLTLTREERTAGAARLLAAAAGQSSSGPPGAIGDGVLVAAPASRRAYKRWPPGRMAALLDGFVAVTRAPVVLVGGPGEDDQLEAVAERMTVPPAMLPVTGIRPLMSVLGAARVVMGPDGGARQLAEALGTPTLALFGPQDPIHWTRLGPRHRAVRGRRPDCVTRCRRGGESCACLAGVGPAPVLSELLDLWSSTP